MDSIRSTRMWMYDRTYLGRSGLKEAFVSGVETFIEFACQQDLYVQERKIRCPCAKCFSSKLLSPNDVKLHLYKKGFKPDYWYWTENGETSLDVGASSSFSDARNLGPEGLGYYSRYHEMIYDAFGVNAREGNLGQNVDDIPNEQAKRFFELLESVNQPMAENCNHTELSAAARLMAIKSGGNVAQHTMDEVAELLREVNVSAHYLPSDFRAAKKLISKLGLSSRKIDCCANGCMLFYRDYEGLDSCNFCGASRYKQGRRTGKRIAVKTIFYLPIIPRLQRLFASSASASHMRWHFEHKRVDGVMIHPSDGAAWKYFDEKYPDFASEPRNVRLGLCADGFNPFNLSGANYSCWPVILTPYNLPPDMCMTAPYMFLTCIIPGPHSPKSKIDVYLQPLIDDLLTLWSTGICMYDISCRQNFTLRAILMWTINDFPAYGMLSGWQTAGRLACPICMENTKAFTLKYGGKQSWFDCHRQFLHPAHPFRRSRTKFKSGVVVSDEPPPRYTSEEVLDRVNGFPKITEVQGVCLPGYGVHHKWIKRSIFWDLPYWKDNLVRHNLDVMHIEKNVFDNICNTVMDVTSKTKDNEKSRKDVEEICHRPELHFLIIIKKLNSKAN